MSMQAGGCLKPLLTVGIIVAIITLIVVGVVIGVHVF